MSWPNAPGPCPAGRRRDLLPPHRSDGPDNPCDRGRSLALRFEAYRDLTDDELERRITAVKHQMGDSLLILGHHYQQDEVIRFADLRGDSFKLSQLAAASQTCRAIVFCGVHFMAETADVLARDEVEVYLPDLAAGCSMADMADLDSVEAAWQDLGDVVDTNDITPVTYINSSADLKAFCGRHGGIVCTSSNARAVLEWSFAKRGRVLFFPDQHLGRNTARAMGIPLDQMAVWDPREPLGGNTEAGIAGSRVLLWRGHCSVHQMFKPEHVRQFRTRFPDSKILVHPECMMQVVDTADLVGSTEFIIKTISSSARRLDMGGRDRAAPGQSPGPREPRQDDPLPVADGLHVRHHVSHRSAPSCLVPRESRPRDARQSHQGAGRDGSLGANRASNACFR